MTTSTKPRARVALVVKRTTYRKFVIEGRDPTIGRLLRKSDPTVATLKRSSELHDGTLREVERALQRLGAEVVSRGGPRQKLPPRTDLVVTVGGDGTLLAASHHIGEDVPLLGINSAPEHSVGFFCGAEARTSEEALRKALEGSLDASRLTRMRVDINGRCLHARVLNEALFAHASPAATSRYILRLTRASGTYVEEVQRSSGIWIGPAAGSTAAQRSAGGRVLPLASRRLQFVVREPYAVVGAQLRCTTGLVDADGMLTVRNKMREGKVFLDGHRIVKNITIGDVIEMRRSDETLTVLGIGGKRRQG